MDAGAAIVFFTWSDNWSGDFILESVGDFLLLLVSFFILVSEESFSTCFFGAMDLTFFISLDTGSRGCASTYLLGFLASYFFTGLTCFVIGIIFHPVNEINRLSTLLLERLIIEF